MRVWMPRPNEEERRKRGLDDDAEVLLVKWINRGQPGGRAAYAAGLREGDVVLEVDGETVPPTPQRLQLDLRLRYKVGDEVPLTVLRDGARKVVKVPLVE
jgi:S1-C subfamily serine protease